MEETLRKILEDFRENEGNIIPILQSIERAFGFIPEHAVAWFAERLDIPQSRFFGVITFYSQFHLRPKGKHVITVCRGTACHVKGSEKLLKRLLLELDMPPGEDTTTDSRFTVERVNCIGACGIAPVAIMDGEVLGKVNLDKLITEVKRIRRVSDE